MIFLWLALILIIVFEVPGMLKRRHYRTLLVFAGLWIFAGTYATLFISRVQLPDIINLLIRILK